MKHYSTYQSQFIEMFASYEMMSNFGDFFSSARNGANIKQGTISGGIPITRIETISDGEVNRDKMGYAGITDNTYSSYYLQDGDILVSHINSMKHIGKCALYQRINDEIIIHGMNLLCLRPCKDVVNPVYVTYLLRSSIMRKLILDITKPAVNQVSFTVKDLCKLKVMLPPISEQEKFAAIVHQADKSKFTHLKSQFIEMFKDLPINGKIEDLVERNIASVKKSYQSGDEIEYIDISSIDNTSNTVVETTKYEVASAPSRAQQCVKNGDILVSTVRPINRNIAVVTSNLPDLVASTGFCILRPKDGYREYLLSVVKSDAYIERMCDKASGGLYPAVNNSDVLSYGIHIPNKELAQKVSSIYHQADKSKYIN